jgi:hypothetical protein
MLEPAARHCPDGRPVRTGEITPAYAILPVARIEAIRHCCPNVRLFFSLRNPLERAWSAAVMEARRAGRLEHECPPEWFLGHASSAESLARGDYAVCLERWWSVFPREQLLVFLHDDIRRAPADLLARLSRHLRIDEADFARIPPAGLADVIVPDLGPGRSNDRPVAPPPGELLSPLRDLYEPLVRRLAALLERDLGDWLQPPRDAAQEATPRRAVNLAAAAPGRNAGRATGDPPALP